MDWNCDFNTKVLGAMVQMLQMSSQNIHRVPLEAHTGVESLLTEKTVPLSWDRSVFWDVMVPWKARGTLGGLSGRISSHMDIMRYIVPTRGQAVLQAAPPPLGHRGPRDGGGLRCKP